MEDNLRTGREQRRRQRDGRRVPDIRHIGLVGDPEQQDPGLGHPGSALLQQRRGALGDPERHPVVDLLRLLRHPERQPGLTGPVDQVQRVDRDAVTAHARARTERGEAERLGRSGGDGVPHVDPQAVAQLGELVDQREVDLSVGVLQDLRRLGLASAAGDVDVLGQLPVEVGRPVTTGRGEPADDLRGVVEAEAGVSGVDPLRGEGEVEVDARLQARLLQQLADDPVGGPGVGGRLDDHQLAGAQMAAHRTGRRDQRAEVRPAVRVHRRGHADHDRGAAAEEGRVGVRVEHPGQRGEFLVRDGVDRRHAGVDVGDGQRVDVESAGDQPGRGRRDGQRQARVADADDSDLGHPAGPGRHRVERSGRAVRRGGAGEQLGGGGGANDRRNHVALQV